MFTWFSSIFGHKGKYANDISYINWLNMVRAGLIALEFYTPENKKWRQVSNLSLISKVTGSVSISAMIVHCHGFGLLVHILKQSVIILIIVTTNC